MTYFTFALIALVSPIAFAANDVLQIPPRVRIGNTVLVDRKINMQTQFVVDDHDTAYLMTYYANMDAKMLRVSRKRKVQQAAMYMGWPYILDKKGRVFAMSDSWKTVLKTKTPILLKRLITKFPYAAASGLTLYGVGWLNVWMHAGTVPSEYSQPEFFGLTGMSIYYLTDIARTAFFRSPQQLGRGGNFFTYKVATGVDRLEFDPALGDYIVHFRDPSESSQFLSHMAPDYTRETNCIFHLTKLVNE